jgi:2-polyprenyl-3-methyl-5-hydroxy-6-metoxy-1,4-benzoquinol methylase
MENNNVYVMRCPICGATSLQAIYTFKDFAVMKCKSCSAAWRSNMYTKEIVRQMYVEEDYDQHPFFSSELGTLENSKNARFRNFQRALAHIESYRGVGKLLDVACGSGTFLALARKCGWEASGVEISPALCEMCRRNTDTTVYNSSFEEAELPENHYDCVTFWDIIEHTLDPLAFVAKARSLLKPGGIMLFCTPDEDSLLANVSWVLYKGTGSRFNYPALALHPRYHTFFFSRASLASLLKQQDIAVVKAYSQEANFQHSPLASELQKKTIGVIERLAAPFDAGYECVVIAQLPKSP